MKNLFWTILFICFLFCNISIEINAQTKEEATQKSVTGKDFPNPFRPIGNLFSRIFGKRKQEVYGLRPNVNALELSHSETKSNCSESDESCLSKKVIDVKAIAAANEEIKYIYEVSGGKIIGEGEKVKWDLSEAKPGTYTIMAGVSYQVSGKWGIWGTIQKQTVTIK